MEESRTLQNRPIWASITSMVIGIVGILACANATPMDEDVGVLIILSIPCIVFASIALAKRYRGKGMAIAGLVMGIMSFLTAMGLASRL